MWSPRSHSLHKTTLLVTRVVGSGLILLLRTALTLSCNNVYETCNKCPWLITLSQCSSTGHSILFALSNNNGFLEFSASFAKLNRFQFHFTTFVVYDEHHEVKEGTFHSSSSSAGVLPGNYKPPVYWKQIQSYTWWEPKRRHSNSNLTSSEVCYW